MVLHLPELATSNHAAIQSPNLWPDVLGLSVAFAGIPEAKLFGGLKAGEVRKLFYDSKHMNLNGQDFFTPLITPALVQIYVETNHL